MLSYVQYWYVVIIYIFWYFFISGNWLQEADWEADGRPNLVAVYRCWYCQCIAMQCRRQFSWYRYRLCHPLGRFSRPYPNMIPNLFTSTLHVQESTALLSTLPVSPFTLADLNHPRTSLDHRGTSLMSSFLLRRPIRSPISQAGTALGITITRFPFET